MSFAFDRHDGNRDGELNIKEAGPVFNAVGFANSDAASRFQLMDTDSSGKISLQEWEEAGKPTGRQGSCRLCMKRNQHEKKCSRCNKDFEQAGHYSKRHWSESDNNRVCNDCLKTNHWKCRHCKIQKQLSEYSTWLQNRSNKKPNGKQWCNVCKGEAAAEDRRIANNNLEFVVSSKRRC